MRIIFIRVTALFIYFERVYETNNHQKIFSIFQMIINIPNNLTRYSDFHPQHAL